MPDAPIGRLGESIGLEGGLNHKSGGKHELFEASIALSPVRKQVASFLLKHMVRVKEDSICLDDGRIPDWLGGI